MDFRFGLGLRPKTSRAEWQDAARRAEALGFDVLLVPDHLGWGAPFPPLVSAAEVTSIRLGTFVLNACFYKPALLTRDAGQVDLLTDGRLELGLGAGYVREEFEAAELPFPTAGARIRYLDHMSQHLREHLPGVPLLIAGGGDKLLTVAAQRADIVGIAGGRHDAPDPLAERVSFVREAAGARFAELELNLAITAVSQDGQPPDLAMTRRFAPSLSDAEMLALPGVMVGSPREIADTLLGHREVYRLTYFTVQERDAESFTKVISELR